MLCWCRGKSACGEALVADGGDLDKSKGPVLAIQGAGGTLESRPKVVPKELLGGCAFPKVTVAPNRTFYCWTSGSDGLIKSFLPFLFLPRLVRGLAFLPVFNVG